MKYVRLFVSSLIEGAKGGLDPESFGPACVGGILCAITGYCWGLNIWQIFGLIFFAGAIHCFAPKAD